MPPRKRARSSEGSSTDGLARNAPNVDEALVSLDEGRSNGASQLQLVPYEDTGIVSDGSDSEGGEEGFLRSTGDTKWGARVALLTFSFSDKPGVRNPKDRKDAARLCCDVAKDRMRLDMFLLRFKAAR